MPDPRDIAGLIELQQQIRIHHNQRRQDFFKHSSEFSRLSITALIALNTGGIIAIPQVSSLLELGKLARDQRLELYLPSGFLFILGVLSGVFCSLLTYYNIKSFGDRAEYESIIDQNVLLSWHAFLNNDERGKQTAAGIIAHHQRGYDIETAKINGSFLYAHALGWLSVACFAVGSAVLLIQVFRLG